MSRALKDYKVPCKVLFLEYRRKEVIIWEVNSRRVVVVCSLVDALKTHLPRTFVGALHG